MKYVAIDYETYYDGDYSLKTMNTWNYVFDKRFSAYLVAIHGDGIHYVGEPSKFDWRTIAGYTPLAHNAGFDGVVNIRLQRDGIIPADLPLEPWIDTADLAVYLRAPRNLAGAVEHLLGRKMSKVVRSAMKGKTYAQAVTAGMEKELLDYGGMDAELCYELFKQKGHLWPASEIRLSQANLAARWKGVTVNMEALQHALTGSGAKTFPGWSTTEDFKGLEIQSWEALKSIPWANDGSGEKALSIDAMRAEGRKVGIEVPASMDAKSEDAMKFEDMYAEKYPWVKAVRNYRRTNALLKKIQSLKEGVRPEDNTFPYESKYFGAHSGRFSGGADKDTGLKFNIMNLPRKAMFGVDLRKFIIPPAGHKFVVVDYAQVEARFLLWRVGDMSFMERLRSEGNLYQAYAKYRNVYDGHDLKNDDYDKYQRLKVEVLSCGYQCGWSRYQNVAKMVYFMDFTDAEAKAAVSNYRTTFPKVVDHWNHHQRQFKFSCINADDSHVVELASGRYMTYYNPSVRARDKASKSWGDEMVASYTMGTPAKKVYGGLLTENEIQATCRDLLRDGWLACMDAGFTPTFSVYDELVFPIPTSEATPATVKEISRLMCESSPWANTEALGKCPVDVEAHVLDYYTK